MLKVIHPRGNFGIIAAYRPPDASLVDFCNELSPATEELYKQTHELAIMGDFNCDFNPAAKQCSFNQPLLDFCDHFNLSCPVVGGTRPISGKQLDLLLLSHGDNFANTDIVPNGASDHSAVITQRKHRPPP